MAVRLNAASKCCNHDNINALNDPDGMNAGDWRNVVNYDYDELNRVAKTTNFWALDSKASFVEGDNQGGKNNVK